MKDSWNSDSLREDVETSAENETSIILYGNMDEKNFFLLTGDAGIRALNSAADYADESNIDLHDINFHQVPHHGSRHNVSGSVLNRIIGPIISEDTKPTKTAFVSVAKGSEQPRQMVVNAYVRRGVKVFEARTSSKWHHKGTPNREDYSTATPLSFNEDVESWD